MFTPSSSRDRELTMSRISDRLIINQDNHTLLRRSMKEKKKSYIYMICCCLKKRKKKQNLKQSWNNHTLRTTTDTKRFSTVDFEYSETDEEEKSIILSVEDSEKPRWQIFLIKQFIKLFELKKFTWLVKVLKLLSSMRGPTDLDLFKNNGNLNRRNSFSMLEQKIKEMEISVFDLQNMEKIPKIEDFHSKPLAKKHEEDLIDAHLNFDHSYHKDNQMKNQLGEKDFKKEYDMFSWSSNDSMEDKPQSLDHRGIYFDEESIESFAKINWKKSMRERNAEKITGIDHKDFLHPSLRSFDNADVHTYIHKETNTLNFENKVLDHFKFEVRHNRLKKCLEIFRELESDGKSFFYELQSKTLEYIYSDYLWVQNVMKDNKDLRAIHFILETLFKNIMIFSKELSQAIFLMFEEIGMIEETDRGEIEKSEVFLTSIITFFFTRPLIQLGDKNRIQVGKEMETLHDIVLPLIVQEHHKGIKAYKKGLSMYIKGNLEISDLSPFLSLNFQTHEAIDKYLNSADFKIPEFIHSITPLDQEEKLSYKKVLERRMTNLSNTEYKLTIKALRKIKNQKSPYFKLFYFLKAIRSIALDIERFYNKNGFKISLILTAEELFPVMILILTQAEFFDLIPHLIITSTFMTDHMSAGEVGHCLNTLYAVSEFIKSKDK